MELGKYNTLILDRITSVGAFLQDDDGEEVLLPTKWIPEGVGEGDDVKVFVYLDHEERPIATTLKPFIVRDSFAWLRVKDVTNHGAFLDWGMEKDLFVPFIEQQSRMQPGKGYVVFMYLDEMTHRLTASSRIEDYVEKENIELTENQEVDLLIAGESDLGFKAIVNHKYLGLIYSNEIFRPLNSGEELKGYVKKIRPDNKIDLSLQQPGYGNVEPNAQKILDLLKTSKGFLPLNDKSEPEEIKDRLQMSKKTFKKAIGSLYKQKIISIENDGIRLK